MAEVRNQNKPWRNGNLTSAQQEVRQPPNMRNGTPNNLNALDIHGRQVKIEHYKVWQKRGPDRRRVQ